MKQIYIAIITAILVLCSYNVVQALTDAEKAELEQRRVELQKKIEEAGKNIENIKVELTGTLEAINALDEEIYQYEEQINKISENLKQVETQIKQTEGAMAGIQARYTYQKRIIGKKTCLRIQIRKNKIYRCIIKFKKHYGFYI